MIYYIMHEDFNQLIFIISIFRQPLYNAKRHLNPVNGETMLKKILEFSWAYELMQNIIGAPGLRRMYINEYVKPLPGMKILDVGCGPGVLVPFLGDVEYYGIDINPLYIGQAAKRYGGKNAHFECAGVSSLGSAGYGEYNIIMMNGVLHHLSDAEADACLAAVKKLLKPGGRFCSFDGVYYDGINPLERFVLDNDRGKFVRTPDAYAALIRKHLPAARFVIKEHATNIPNPLIIFY